MGDTNRITRRDVLQVLDVNEEFLIELEEESIIDRDERGTYPASELERIRLCLTLHDELGVNIAGLEVALHLIEALERERAQFLEVISRIREELDT